MNYMVAETIRTHVSPTNDDNIYSPVFVNQDARDTRVDGGVGYYTPIYFGVHNGTGSAVTVTVWTVDQGPGGSGVSVVINSGDTFFAKISKINVTSGTTVVLLGANYKHNI